MSLKNSFGFQIFFRRRVAAAAAKKLTTHKFLPIFNFFEALAKNVRASIFLGFVLLRAENFVLKLLLRLQMPLVALTVQVAY